MVLPHPRPNKPNRREKLTTKKSDRKKSDRKKRAHMKSFEDKSGAKWELEVTVGVVKRVRAVLNIDLAKLDETLYERLADDPVLLVDLLWVLCEKQAQGRQISDEQFGEGLAGDSIEAATTALLEAVADFFPGPRRSLFQKVISKTATIEQTASKLAIAKLDDPRLEKAMQERLNAEFEKALTQLSSATSSPESPASMPATKP